jgi:hypothetical protein
MPNYKKKYSKLLRTEDSQLKFFNTIKSLKESGGVSDNQIKKRFKVP